MWRKAAIAWAATGFLTAPALAQGRWDCSGWSRDDGQGRYCELRDFTISNTFAPLSVDGDRNGGIRISGWDRSEVHVEARVQTWGRTEAEARDLADDIEIRTDGGRIEAETSSGIHRGWSVSYDIQVPRNLRFQAKNGGISLSRLGGNVKGRTTNGGVTVELDGASWDGEGLDVATTNGGVKLHIPEDYSAELETGTTNGRMRVDFPITVQGRVDRRIRTTLGAGGAPVRVTTTNGGVVVRRRR